MLTDGRKIIHWFGWEKLIEIPPLTVQRGESFIARAGRAARRTTSRRGCRSSTEARRGWRGAGRGWLGLCREREEGWGEGGNPHTYLQVRTCGYVHTQVCLHTLALARPFVHSRARKRVRGCYCVYLMREGGLPVFLIWLFGLCSSALSLTRSPSPSLSRSHFSSL